MRSLAVVTTATATVVITAGLTLAAQSAGAPPTSPLPSLPANVAAHVGPTPSISTMTGHAATFDMRGLPQLPARGQRRTDAIPEPEDPATASGATGPTAPIGAGQASTSAAAPAPGVDFAFDGLAYNSTCGTVQCGGGHPPDTNGDVGATYYVETVNTAIGIFNKTTGATVAAVSFNSFMSQGAFGNLCDTNNFGDPVVLYDTFASRWIITDFAFVAGSGGIPGPSYQCFAVSKTSDPVSGGWNYYSLQITSGLQDYPKFGIWPDGLYMSANMFSFGATQTWQNVRVWAFDKAAMEAGSANVTTVAFDAPSSIGSCGVFTLLPSNARVQTGTPPAGREDLFASVPNPGTNACLSGVWVWKFHADWTTPANSTFTGPSTSTTTTGWGVPPSSVPELNPANPASPLQLDALEIRLMMQNQYTNIGGVESLWDSHTVEGSTTSQTAVRWYQVPVTGGTVASALQASTYNPDTSDRWMSSLGVDQAGDMAIGYSVSSASMHPAIRYAGRLAGDAANTISQTETSLIEGTGSQVGGCGPYTACPRWGDYSAMTLDPDGCTFWYANEYYATNDLNDRTRISSFHFPSCVSGPPPSPSPVASPSIGPSPTPDKTPPTVATPVLSASTVIPGASVTVTSSASDPSGVASAQVRVGSGAWATMSESDGSFGGTTEGLRASVTAPGAAGGYQVCVRATDTASNTSSGGACTTLTVKSFTLAGSPTSNTVTQGAATTYTVNITGSSFPDGITFSATGLPAGATASFSPNPSTGASTSLTVTTSNCGTVTPRGTYSLSVTGSGAGLSRTIVIGLTVTNGAPKITSGPASRDYQVTTMGSTSSPVRTSWAACDPDGIASYTLQRQVNSGSWVTVTLSSATATSIVQSLTYGNHYRYRLRSTDKLGAVSGFVYGPTFELLTTDQSSSAVHYGGTWYTGYTSYAYGGSLRYATAAGASVSYTFTGSGIAWTAYRGPNRGSARVYIDGVLFATVSLYSSTYQARSIVYSVFWGVNGTHTIKIVVVGTAGHPRVDLDAFVREYNG